MHGFMYKQDSDDESDHEDEGFSYGQARPQLQNWVKSLSSKDRKKIGVLLYNHLQHHHNLGKVESAESTAVALGIEKRTVTRWHKEYYREKGDISGDKRGKYRLCLLYTSPSPRDRQKSRMPSSA